MGRGLLGLNTLAPAHLALALPFAVCPVTARRPRRRNSSGTTHPETAMILRSISCKWSMCSDILSLVGAQSTHVAPEHPFFGAHVQCGPDGFVCAKGGGEVAI